MKLLTKRTLNTSSVNWTKKVEKLERPWASMSLIYTLLGFLDCLRSKMFKNYAKILRMI